MKISGYGVSAGSDGRVAVNTGPRSLDAFEAAVLALNLPASSAGVNYQFSQGSFICVPNLYSSSGAWAASLSQFFLLALLIRSASKRGTLGAALVSRHAGMKACTLSTSLKASTISAAGRTVDAGRLSEHLGL